VVDHDGNSTTMEFSNFRINDLSGLSIYNFIPPATAQVVRPPTGVP
jgi:outer membrane lipoprotein-sorting protein